MFIFDRVITASVLVATDMLNESPDLFAWLDQEPGVPIFIYDSRLAGWYQCVRSKEGIYGVGDCKEGDLPEEDIPVLYLQAEPTRAWDHRSHRVNLPLVGRRTKEERVAAEAIVVAALEQKKRLEMVQAWVSIHITFPGFRDISPWILSKRPHHSLHVTGPTVHTRYAPNQPTPLPLLGSKTFRETMARFHLDEGMVLTDRHTYYHNYIITSEGIKFIYDYYNTREALTTLALGMVQAQKGGRAENTPLVALVQSPMFEPKLLGKISTLMGVPPSLSRPPSGSAVASTVEPIFDLGGRPPGPGNPKRQCL
jgi:hypothetical protein